MAQYMLCRNTVRDFEVWKKVFDEEIERGATGASGLELVSLWRSLDNPNEAHFVFKINDMAKAKAFVEDPASAETGERAGVIGGEISYIEDLP